MLVHSIFPTLQGEGPYAGKPAIFIRLTGCNLQCPKCDTDYTSEALELTHDEIVTTIHNTIDKQPGMEGTSGLFVITGGEPLRQQGLLKLVKHLYWEFPLCEVQVETNGTLAMPTLTNELQAMPKIVCSPKTGSVNPKLWPHITAYKYVLHAGQVDPNDGLPTTALEHSAKPRVARPHPGFDGPVYLQPIDEQDPELNNWHMKSAMRSCFKYGYMLCLQLHKFLGLD